MYKVFPVAIAFWLLSGLLHPAVAAITEAPRVGVEANASIWWTMLEQVENGLEEQGSRDAAAEEASGFNLKQGRVAIRFETLDSKISALVRLRLEERTDLLDFWGKYRFAPWLEATIGQRKIPSTAEVLQPDQLTDFITRTTFGQNLVDYSLARTPYISSLMSIKSYNRDLGAALEGEVPGKQRPLGNYFVMVSNGIGSNNYIGGNESPEFLWTNRFGDFCYGARVEVNPLAWVTLGSHVTWNRHDNAVLQDKKSVVDFERTAWSTDFRVSTPWSTRLEGFYGSGKMRDFLEGQPYRFDFDGWAVWVLQGLFDNQLELGIRYDVFGQEFFNDGNKTEQRNWTFGVNYRPLDYIRIQLNYILKDTHNKFVKDVDDNILFTNFQFLFDAWLTK